MAIISKPLDGRPLLLRSMGSVKGCNPSSLKGLLCERDGKGAGSFWIGVELSGSGGTDFGRLKSWPM